MRKQIDKVKSFGKFLNENVEGVNQQKSVQFIKRSVKPIGRFANGM